MKAKELIEILQTAPEAEVGFEHIKITNAWKDSDEYVELDGQTAMVNYENKKSGVFVVITEYENASPEVSGIYLTRKNAEKLRDWLEKYPTADLNGYGNIKRVHIDNMFIYD